MPENLMSRDHKATNQNYRNNYERTFRFVYREPGMIAAPPGDLWGDEESMDNGPLKGRAVIGESA